ncbi:MAG: ATP-binding cassette domain-containing protein [Treponema sp.]|jgi:ABC-2 type transport system ATP-binding protein|nr:ATP-binding cassette domain-containing protein [Treponema sp.]
MIEVKNLTKRYGGVRAVTDVSFSVGEGQVLGFLGPNGAGKTTIMKILTGFHFPTSGTALIDGIPVDEDPVEVKKRVGYMPENVPLYGDMTVDEYLRFAAEARLIPRRERAAAIGACLEACSLTHYRGRKIETLSKGYRQRAGLAQAIIHNPPILILDEPTTGLDPNQIIEIRALIKELGKTKTVILCTHILQEVGAVCSQVLIINEGRIAAQGTPDEISGTMKGGDTWELVLKGADESAVKKKLALLEGAANVTTGGEEDGTVTAGFFIPYSGGTASGERVFDWAVAQNLKILGMNRKKLSIEDIFVKLTGDEKTAGRQGDEK